jgi:BlaI family penicillinase repressor
MSTPPKITEAEWVIMKIFWERSPLTANQVVEQLSESDWNPKTIRTLIIRLRKKNALGFDKQGREYRYFPIVHEHECVRQQTHSLLSRAGMAVFKPMLAAFLQEQQLSEREIEELKHILENKSKDTQEEPRQ